MTGITEFRLPTGERRYLSPAIGCLDGRPVSWSVGPRPTAALADSSLAAAGAAPVVHSDRGCRWRRVAMSLRVPMRVTLNILLMERIACFTKAGIMKRP